MSVLGLDLGNANCVIAVAQRGGVDIIANEASNRATPSLVGFGDRQRFVGEGALTQQLTNLKNTVGNIKLLLGRRWNDQAFQNISTHLAFNNLVEIPGGLVAVKVTYRGEPRTVLPEQLFATLLVKLKQLTEKETGVKVSDVVISVPSHFDVFQRRAALDSARVAGLSVLRIVNDHIAAAINYGIYKIDMPEDSPRRVMVVDVGDIAFKVSIIEFTKSKAKVVSSVSEHGLGGFGIDLAIANHFADQFLAKYNIDLRQQPKGWFRLLSAVIKLKKILNANPSAPLSVECIYEEYDINSMLTREEYEIIIKPFLERIPAVLQAGLDSASLKVDDIFSVELIGAASRTQPIQRTIAGCLQKDLSFTMNAEEGVAKGCALQCAILSPKFRVRDYTVVDIVESAIEVVWRTLNDPQDTTEKSVVIFPAGSPFPAPKFVSFTRPQSKPFSITVRYKDRPYISNPVIAVITIPNIPTPTLKGDADVRVRISLDINGTVRVETVELLDKYEAEVEPAAMSPTPMDVDPKAPVVEQPTAVPAAAPSSGQQASSDGDNDNMRDLSDSPQPDADASVSQTKQQDGGDKNAQAEQQPQPPAATGKKLKVRRVPIQFDVQWTHGLSEEDVVSFQKMEDEILKATEEVVGVIEAKNAVESYVYDARDKLNSSWRQFISDADYEFFEQQLEETSNWLYDEEHPDRDIYINRLSYLRSLGDPVAVRKYEFENGPLAVTHCRSVINDYMQKATGPLEEYSHISREDKDRVVQEVEKVNVWLDNLVQHQSALAPTENPVLLSRDVYLKAKELSDFADPIMNVPKNPQPTPAPQKQSMETEEPKKGEAAPETGGDQAPKPETGDFEPILNRHESADVLPEQQQTPLMQTD